MNERLRRRALLLDRACSFIEQAINSISYALVPPDRLICDFKDDTDFFAGCRKDIEKTGNVHSAWQCAMKKSRDAEALNREERKLLEQLGQSLGIYDSQGQLDVLRRFEAEFTSARQTARRELCERSKTHMTCSLLTGVLIAIIII